MKLEIGKFYRDREGYKHGPLRVWPDENRVDEFDVSPDGDDGGFWHHDGASCNIHIGSDLVSPWPSIPAGYTDTGEFRKVQKGEWYLAATTGTPIEFDEFSPDNKPRGIDFTDGWKRHIVTKAETYKVNFKAHEEAKVSEER